jgi:hypothetical protein
MNLVGNTGTSARSRWKPATVAARTRPGDRPVWVRVAADTEHLLDASIRARIPVDAAAALVLEWSLCADVLSVAEGGPLVELARVELAQPRLAPTDDLRAWEQQLAGRGPEPEEDELPEVCLPERIAARLPKTVPVTALHLAELDDAALCDRAAARLGMTLEVWVLRRVLAG